MQHEIREYAINGGPITGVVGLSLLGIPVSDWACLAALVWTVIQISLSIYDRIQRHKAKSNGR